MIGFYMNAGGHKDIPIPVPVVWNGTADAAKTPERIQK
jgi:hypothetical protein